MKYKPLIGFLLAIPTVTIILLGVYATQEFNENPSAGKLIIAQNVIATVCALMTIPYLIYTRNKLDDQLIIVIFWDYCPFFLVAMFFACYGLGWGSFARMCQHYTCFTYITPLYIMTLIELFAIDFVIFIAIMYFCITNCCSAVCGSLCRGYGSATPPDDG